MKPKKSVKPSMMLLGKVSTLIDLIPTRIFVEGISRRYIKYINL